jgi:hypothetical protein
MTSAQLPRECDSSRRRGGRGVRRRGVSVHRRGSSSGMFGVRGRWPLTDGGESGVPVEQNRYAVGSGNGNVLSTVPAATWKSLFWTGLISSTSIRGGSGTGSAGVCSTSPSSADQTGSSPVTRAHPWFTEASGRGGRFLAAPYPGPGTALICPALFSPRSVAECALAAHVR